jgi:multiple sugar transport system permease protein
VNAGLQAVGLPRQGFLQNPSQALVVLAIVYFWTQFGFNIVIYLAALQDVPQEVLEAAAIDGAGRWAKVLARHPADRPAGDDLPPGVGPHRRVPVLRPGLHDHEGGPLNSTLTLVYYIYQLAFNFFTAGYGAAVAYVLFFTSLIAIVAALAFGRRRRVTL